MAMDPSWIYTEFLQTSREYILHLQQLGILLITAIAIVFYNNISSKNIPFFILIGLAFFISIINLYIGLTLYGNLLELILDSSLKLRDLTSIKCYIYFQFFAELCILLLLIIAIIANTKFWGKK